MIDLRFPTALQMVLSVALADRHTLRCTSQILAEGLGTNPSCIRKLLIPLSHEGMIATTTGKGGGLHLGRSPGEITLRDIYQAVTAEKKILAPRQNVPSLCVISSNINKLFLDIMNDIEESIYNSLEKRTVEDSLRRIIILEIANNPEYKDGDRIKIKNDEKL
jgi:Rrf2 family transcriptional regulator, repressor of oqxAB